MHYEITWKAKYKNNINSHSNKNGDKYTDIDRKNLESIEVYLNSKIIHTLLIEKDKRLIMRYRVQQDINNPNKSTYIFLIGWQQTINGKNIQEITYIFPDGKKEVSGKWDNTKALYSEVKLRDDEK
jgi:hypothetical protein